ncbi:hypothetical protein GUITHDRAFT_155405 [Guillardia theta CCMP2712]|uniref:HTH myb-type domain-containing protein n=1 Tax=Guillardia theta (strain CCMP2712) TaxID=905079 RepID=L1IHK4_GUITC|nr:hypothetical protein GUITHDRAFT_155405 [Guillardia theta CCMP2712]EKX35731.1 hypothetical protein GUITHDRAFT_155405 [Guillardia theta CCMP2712]|eukprot:XP_005822711.1 hypothetical protein GUITHDRAFT_155405 [Guillardia theta CCMP2712]
MEANNLRARDIQITLDSEHHYDTQSLFSDIDGRDLRRKTNLKSVVSCDFDHSSWFDTSVDDAIDALYNPKAPFAYSRQKVCNDPFQDENTFDFLDVYFEDECTDMQSEDGLNSISPVEANSSSPQNCKRTQSEQAQTISLYKTGHWSEDEHNAFLDALAKFGPKKPNSGVKLGPGVAELIALAVKTRSVSQVRSHAQKYFKKNDAFACVARLQPLVGTAL